MSVEVGNYYVLRDIESALGMVAKRLSELKGVDKDMVLEYQTLVYKLNISIKQGVKYGNNKPSSKPSR